MDWADAKVRYHSTRDEKLRSRNKQLSKVTFQLFQTFSKLTKVTLQLSPTFDQRAKFTYNLFLTFGQLAKVTFSNLRRPSRVTLEPPSNNFPTFPSFQPTCESNIPTLSNFRPTCKSYFQKVPAGPHANFSMEGNDMFGKL